MAPTVESVGRTHFSKTRDRVRRSDCPDPANSSPSGHVPLMTSSNRRETNSKEISETVSHLCFSLARKVIILTRDITSQRREILRFPFIQLLITIKKRWRNREIIVVAVFTTNYRSSIKCQTLSLLISLHYLM